jgi:hypothetical protein
MKAERTKNRRENSALLKHLSAMHDMGGGLWGGQLVHKSGLFHPAAAISAAHWLTELEQGKGLGPLCLLCDVEFAWPRVLPEWFFFLTPYGENPRLSVASGICTGCSAWPSDELLQAVFVKFRDSLVPDLRIIDSANIHIGAGRA